MKKAIVKKPNKGLQKFTVEKFEALQKKSIVSKDELNKYNESEREKFMIHLFDQVNRLDGTERMNFMNKFESFFSETTKNQLWENNHILITGSIDKLMREYNRMPSCTEIANDCGLSRVTVNNHSKSLKQSTFYKTHKEQYEIALDNLIAKLYKFAVKGDMKAAKLFLDNFKEIDEHPTVHQTNYIQINNLILDQTTINKLQPRQLKEIEQILLKVV